MDVDVVHIAGSKNEKTSKFDSKKTEKSGPLHLENNNSNMVNLGDKEWEGGGICFASDSSHETKTLV